MHPKKHAGETVSFNNDDKCSLETAHNLAGGREVDSEGLTYYFS